MARVAGGDAGELAVDARAGAARADPGRSPAARPGPAPAGADCRRPRPARTERLRSWPMTSRAEGERVGHLNGRGRIMAMDLWAQEAMDLGGAGFIGFGDDGTGGFGCIAVRRR